MECSRKLPMVMATNLTSIFCVYKETFAKTTNTEECRVHKNSESCNIRHKNPFNSKQIIQILQPIIIDIFSTHS